MPQIREERAVCLILRCQLRGKMTVKEEGGLETSRPLFRSTVIMANLIRSAKSGGDWTLNDLESYHISVNGNCECPCLL